jgi:hypothetical protein
VLYEISNPSDAITIEHDDEMVASVAVLFVGKGAYGLKRTDGTQAMPIFLLGGAQDWLASRSIDLDSYVPAHLADIASALESVRYVRTQTSLTGIVAYAHELASRLRAKAAA